MRKTKPFTIVLLVLVGVVGAIALAKSASVLLREGLYSEEVEGDLDAAIGVYKQIIADASAPREQVAQALYRLGMCHMKRKDEIEATAAFRKLAADYGDQTQLIEKVKPLLEELGNADPASLMPPDTLAYIEIGSPGKQVETILSMLKDTPFENPLAMIGQNQSNEGQIGPQQIIGSLMNPSMMAEFKKIRGIGIGITGITQDNPPAIAVLYPGKSDALRGIIQMGLGFVGQPAQAIEGMTTLSFGDGGGAAYDDTVIIVTSPSPRGAELLQWSVKQYKGLIKEPSLASSNKSFAKIGKKARQDNMLTLWFNADEAYQNLKAILPPDAMPEELHMAEHFADLKNIDDVIASLSVRQSGLALDANVNLREGHNCLAYNMIRTPRLNRAALNTVPSDAIALISLGVGESGTPQAVAVSEQIRNAMGLDIGPQLFDNIEQITLFAVPFRKPTEQLSEDMPPQIKSIGLAITSVDPQQTYQILSSTLRSANLITEETQPTGGRFDFTLPNQQKLFGRMDQAGKVTVLSLSSDLVDASMNAARQRAGSLQGGPLQEILQSLPEATSKLAVVNVAGAMQYAVENMELPSGQVAYRVREAMAQLTQASAKTTVRLQTSEEANSFAVHLTVDNLPPISKLLGPMQQIADGMSEIEGRDEEWGAEPVSFAGIAPTDQAPAVDGKVDGCWAKAQAYALEHNFYDSVADESDCSASFKTLCDKDNLYVLVEVADDELCNDSSEFWYDDGVEIFVDADNSRSGSYGDNDCQYYFHWHPASPVMGESKHGKTDGVEFAFARTDDGYRLEVRFPWNVLGAKPSPGTSIGFDVQVNDDDGGGERDSKLAWNAVEDDAWQNTGAFGVAQPLGLVGWWKLDESSGDEASDASGNGRTSRLEGDPTWQPAGGKVGGALAFDGQDDYVDTGYNTDTPTWTIAAWVKSPAAPADDKQTGPVHREKNYQINWDHMVDRFRGGAGVCIDGVWHGASFGDLEADTWYHMAATYDGENLKAYKNGVLITDNADPSGVPNAEGETLKLARHAKNAEYFRATVDDARLYNYALDAAQIAKLAGK